MQRNLFALVIGTSLLGAAALASCGGGGSSSTPAAPAAAPANVAPGGTQITSNGHTLTVTINRAPVVKTRKGGQAKARAASQTRKPAYFSGGTKGLQIAISSPGSATVTQYVDIYPGSPNCTTSGPTETCVLAIPTIGTSESLVITEVDQPPSNEGVAPNPAGYGSGFPNGTNILAVGTATASITGATAISIALNPVLAEPFDSEDQGDQNFNTLTPTSTTNAAFDEETTTGGNADRIVVTAGVAQTLFDQLCFFDADGTQNYASPQPQQTLVDVNGSPQPITWTSSSQHATLAIYNRNAPATPSPGSFGLTASTSDTSLMTAGNCIAYQILLDGALTQPATLTLKNNLTAINPFTSASYGKTEVVTIVPISVSTPAAAISQGTMSTTTVTGSDFQGTSGLTPFASVDSNGQGYNAGACLDSGAVTRATVAQSAAINTTTWLQTFTITPAATPTIASPVTCTFVLADVNTGTNSLMLPGYVVTPTVTITVTP